MCRALVCPSVYQCGKGGEVGKVGCPWNSHKSVLFWALSQPPGLYCYLTALSLCKRHCSVGSFPVELPDYLGLVGCFRCLWPPHSFWMMKALGQAMSLRPFHHICHNQGSRTVSIDINKTKFIQICEKMMDLKKRRCGVEAVKSIKFGT